MPRSRPYIQRPGLRSLIVPVSPATPPWPGQIGNPVGFAAAPGFNTNANPNGAGNLAALQTLNTYALAQPGNVIASGTPVNPTIVQFLDIVGPNSGTTPTYISADGTGSGAAIHDVKFVGCRFQNACVKTEFNVDCLARGSSNITFSYCSFVPLRSTSAYYSKVASPAVLTVSQPGSWPSASVGTGLADSGGGVSPLPGGGAGVYQTPYLSGSLTNLSIGATLGTFMLVDHCDFWGTGFSIKPAGTSTTTMTFTDNWMHDNRFPVAPTWDPAFTYIADTTFQTGAYVVGNDGNTYLCLINNSGIQPAGDLTGHWTEAFTNDHSEVFGFAQGTIQPPWNLIVRHNTLATLGNTGVFVWQSTLSHYQNIAMINNYLSGTNDIIDAGTLATGAINTGWTFTDNVFATDLQFFACILDHSGSSPNGTTQTQFTNSGAFAAANNLWRRNTLKVFPGDTWSGLNASNGKFVLPEGGSIFNTTDWSN
jgi:hypothetical protein